MPAEETRMATALFVVKATIAADREAEFNRWYNEEHCPQVLRYPGAVSARRYKAILGEDRFQYMAVYEFQDDKTLHAFLASAHFKELRAEYDKHFGGASERARFGYTQVWP
jgi:antibiotic biosynthesis monooxygenase (ABM) superfamily enzyme